MTTKNKLQNIPEKLIKHTNNRLFLYFGRFLVVVLFLYSISPFVIEKLIRNNLPSNIKLEILELSYPNISGISLSKIEGYWDKYRFEIVGLSLDYSANNIEVHSMKLTVPPSEDQELKVPEKIDLSRFLTKGKFVLPQLELDKIDLRKAIENINIDILDVDSPFGQGQLVNFNLNVDQLGQLRANGIIVKNEAQGGSVNYSVSASLLDSFESNNGARDNTKSLGKTAEFELLIGGQRMVVLSLIFKEKQARLSSKLSEKGVKFLSKILGRKESFSNITKLQFDWSNDSSSNYSNLVLKGETSINNELLSNLFPKGISLKGDKNNQLNNALWQIELGLKGGNNMNVNGVIKYDDELIISCLEEKYCGPNQVSSFIVKKPNLAFSSSATVKFDANYIEEIEFKESQLKLLLNSLKVINRKIVPTKSSDKQGAVQTDRMKETIVIEDLVLRFATEPMVLNLGSYQNNSDSMNKALEELKRQIKLINRLTADELAYSQIVAEDNAQKTFSSPIESEFSIYFAENGIVQSDGELELAELTVVADESLLNGTLQFDWSNIDERLSSGKANLELVGSPLLVDSITLDQVSMNAKVDFKPQNIEGVGRIKIADRELTPYEFKYDKKTSTTLIELSKDQLESKVFNPIVKAIGKKNQLNVELAEGITKQKTHLSFTDNLTIDSRMVFDDMLFVFGENTISGMRIQKRISSIDPLTMDIDLSVEKVEFSSGLLVENVKGQIDTSSIETSILKNLKANLFEGELTAKKFKFSDGKLQPSLIKVSNISLTELIFFMDINGLYGEGLLNISLPLSMVGDSLVIKNGRFEAESEGILKYSGTEPNPGEEENIALKALRNFHYKTLEGDISYDQEGAYEIKLHLLGSNPDLYDGYPIDFVLNLNGELSGVFRSLFLTGSFEEAVMEKVKTGQIEQQQTDNE